VILGATNRLELMDPAVIRSGRFDLLLELPKPDVKAREAIFGIHTRQKPLAEDVDLKALAKQTEGRTGSDIEFVCRKASLLAIAEFVDKEADGLAHRSQPLRGRRWGPRKVQDKKELTITNKHFTAALRVMENQPR